MFIFMGRFKQNQTGFRILDIDTYVIAIDFKKFAMVFQRFETKQAQPESVLPLK